MKECHLYQLPIAADIGFDLPELKINLKQEWPAGEAEAFNRLTLFLNEKGGDYQTNRDFPSIKGTSRLSAYLALGVISAKQCVSEARKRNNGKLDSGNSGLV